MKAQDWRYDADRERDLAIAAFLAEEPGPSWRIEPRSTGLPIRRDPVAYDHGAARRPSAAERDVARRRAGDAVAAPNVPARTEGASRPAVGLRAPTAIGPQVHGVATGYASSLPRGQPNPARKVGRGDTSATMRLTDPKPQRETSEHNPQPSPVPTSPPGTGSVINSAVYQLGHGIISVSKFSSILEQVAHFFDPYLHDSPCDLPPLGCEGIDLTGGRDPFASDSDSSAGFVLTGEWEECDASLVTAAWSMLSTNPDLVEWALCNAGASADLIECVLDQLAGNAAPIKLNAGGANCDDRMNQPPGTDKINVCVNASWWVDTAGLYCTSVNPDDLACAIIHVACTLLHELTHYCGAAGHKNLSEESIAPGVPTGVEYVHCAVPDYAQALFAAAAVDLFEGAADAECCAKLLELEPGYEQYAGTMLSCRDWS